MAILIVAALGFTGIYVLRQKSLAEDKFAAQARDDYAQGDYATAAQKFEKLAADFPGSDKAGEYKFFADLAGTQSAARAAGAADDPAASLKRLNGFLDAHKDSPLAKPAPPAVGARHPGAGQEGRRRPRRPGRQQVAGYRADRTKSDALAKAEATVAEGRKLADRLDPFRGPSDRPSRSSRPPSIRWSRT